MKTNNNNNSMDDMSKQVLKEERAALAAARKEERAQKSAEFQAKRLAAATARLDALKTKDSSNIKGIANQSLTEVHINAANTASVRGLLDGTIALIKQVAAVSSLPKDIIKVLKATAAEVVLDNVTDTTLPLYIDSKGAYKFEAAYRLVCSRTKNPEVATVLKNIAKQGK